MNRLANKTILVTAAGQGMGHSAVLACVREGARVIATDFNADLLKSLSGSALITTRPLNVLDVDAIQKLVAEFAGINTLFNCAGYVHHGALLECAPQDWDRSFNLNVRSMYMVTRAVLPGMIALGGGVILNMASVLGAHKAAPNRLAYAASKAAVQGFTRAVALDYVKQNIRCNCVCPGTVDTPSLTERINAAADPVKSRQDFVARQPMGRLATADEIAETFVYLLSDESSFVTGQAIFADGGMSL
jgi:NAD(P)-dependent dehydrogenase (short-subunit alcohol dehydrogenase family)